MPDRTRFTILVTVAAALSALQVGAVRADQPRKPAGHEEQAEKPADRTGQTGEKAATPAPRAKKPGEKAGKQAAAPVSPLVAAARANAARGHVADLPRRIDPRTGREVIVVTNKELDRYYRPIPQESHPIASLPPVTPAKAGEARKPGLQGGPAATRARQEKIRQIQAEIERLNRKILSLHNPYLPRPKESAEERRAEQGLDNRQRLEQTQKRLAELQAELARLQGGNGTGGDNR